MAKISKDIPLAELTLRKYEKPASLSDRELIRKLCLSLGVLQPGDSRDIIVEVLRVILNADKPMTSTEVEKATVELRKQDKLPLHGVAPSNIRRQILRLRDIFIVEKQGNYYRINEDENLQTLFSEKLEKYYLESIMKRVKEYVKETDKRFSNK